MIKLRGRDALWRASYGQGDMGRIYERLRKRAYRRWRRGEDVWDKAMSTDEWQDAERYENQWLDGIQSGTYISEEQRDAYLQGVRDALNAVYDESVHEGADHWESFEGVAV